MEPFLLPPDFREEADRCRAGYLNGIGTYLDRQARQAAERRRRLAETMPQEDRRRLFVRMLGLDRLLAEPAPAARQDFLCETADYRLYRLTVPVTEEIPLYALLFLPKTPSPMPLIVAQHGGGGTPELCSDLAGPNNYNHMVQRLLRRGAAVLAPQLLLWSTEETQTMRRCAVPYRRQPMDDALRRFGVSLTGLELAGIHRCLDAALALPEIDPDRVGMVGLSYGGYFTLHAMAADTRIKAGYSAGCFNSRDAYPWRDWCYPDSANLFQDAEVAALCIPRPLSVAVGRQDPVFDYRTAVPEGQRAAAYYAAAGYPDRFRFCVWEGGHTVEDREEGYDFLFDRLSII